MTFDISPKMLERLEWPRVLERLGELTASPLARARWGEAARSLLEADPARVRERLDETGEARAILAEGEQPPLADALCLEDALARAGRDGVLSGPQLGEVASCLAAVHATARFLELRRARGPRLAALAERMPDLRDLAAEIAGAFEPSGELRDAASQPLAAARREARRLAAGIRERLDRLLRDPDTRACLTDDYYTLRNDRYVLPVRSDARGSLRGIVHGASGSGTTVFVEPEALVGANNRLKQCEIEIERETRRVLRDFSRRVARQAAAIRTGLDALEAVDRAFARARLADEMRAVAPEVGEAGVLRLPQLRHPLLPPDRAVENDLRLGEGFHVLVLSGPNAGGKTVTMKAVALAALFIRAGLHVPAGEGARVDLFDRVLADIGDEQDIRESLSTFSAHMANLSRIVDSASSRTLVVLDEVGVGTDPGEGASLAQAVLEALADSGARVVVTTHYNLLKEMAAVDARFENASFDFDPDTLEPTYRLRFGVAGASSATAVAARMGLRAGVIERANALMDREDRRLDRLLAELSASRAALDREQREAERSRAASEAARAEYRQKLERLQARRDELFRAMREDLDAAFQEAHAQVAGVIRELQRGSTARDAARAREALLALAEETRREEERAAGPEPAEPGERIDWRFARAGDPVRVAGGAAGVLETLPDHRGRVTLRVGTARVVVAAERVHRHEASGPPPRAAPPAAAPLEDGDGGSVDLRGLRVDEALDRLDEALDRAVAAGRPRLTVVHGIGTGALLEAVRRHLGKSPYVARLVRDEGGPGATVVEL